MKRISKKLLKIICCPVCKSDLKYVTEMNNLLCRKCNKHFDIKDGIPILIA